MAVVNIPKPFCFGHFGVLSQGRRVKGAALSQRLEKSRPVVLGGLLLKNVLSGQFQATSPDLTLNGGLYRK